MRCFPFKSSKVFYLVVIAMMLVTLAGCQKELKTGYGRSRGSNYTASVNGTIVLDKMIKSSGRRVRHYRRISPRWYQHDTIFWIPDDFSPPNQNVIDKVEDWLESEPDKTLVYVARDYDAAIVYWDHLRNVNAKMGQADDNTSREYANSLSSHLANSPRGEEQKSCAWYDWKIKPFQKARSVTGDFANSLDTENAEIHYGSLPVPGEITDSGTFNDYQVEVLLTVDSIPLVYTLSRQDWDDSKIIIIGNGSMVLNLPLTNQVNRQIASRLLETVDESDYDWGDVLFVENQGKIVVSDVDAPEVNSKWSWITKPPLRYMVPNLVFWCMLFCFVYFPIFGRPRNIVRNSTSNFRDHIFALARLIAGTNDRSQPTRWLEQYQKNSSRNQKSR